MLEEEAAETIITLRLMKSLDWEHAVVQMEEATTQTRFMASMQPPTQEAEVVEQPTPRMVATVVLE